MVFQDVAALPSRASFSTTFLNDRGRIESLMTTTFHKTFIRGKQGHDPSKIPMLQQSLFL